MKQQKGLSIKQANECQRAKDKVVSLTRQAATWNKRSRVDTASLTSCRLRAKNFLSLYAVKMVALISGLDKSPFPSLSKTAKAASASVSVLKAG
jgi:hypothetical protein